MGSTSFSKTGGRTYCAVTVYYEQTPSGANFYFTYSGECEAYNVGAGWKWYTNSQGNVWIDVDGTESNSYAFVYAHSSGASAPDLPNQAWKPANSGTSNTVSVGPKNDGYVVTVHWSGSISSTESTIVTYTFTLPIFGNDSGEIKAFEKVYINDGGTIKECTVYTNVGGVIKEIS